MLHEAGQGHGEGTRELGDRTGSFGKQLHDLPARRVGERREDGIEGLF